MIKSEDVEVGDPYRYAIIYNKENDMVRLAQVELERQEHPRHRPAPRQWTTHPLEIMSAQDLKANKLPNWHSEPDEVESDVLKLGHLYIESDRHDYLKRVHLNSPDFNDYLQDLTGQLLGYLKSYAKNK